MMRPHGEDEVGLLDTYRATFDELQREIRRVFDALASEVP